MHARKDVRCHRTLEHDQVSLVLAQCATDLMGRLFHVPKIIGAGFERWRSNSYEYSISSIDGFRCVRSEMEGAVRNGAAQNLGEPRFMDGTSACSQCFHDVGIFIDACHAIANRCKHSSAYEPNVPRPNDCQPLHKLSNLSTMPGIIPFRPPAKPKCGAEVDAR